MLAPNASPYERDKLGNPAGDRQGARRRKRAAARLSQPGRRPGRTRLRGRLVRRQRRRFARRAASRLPPHGRAHGVGARRKRLALRRGAARGGRAGRRGRLRRLRPGPARLRQRQSLPRRRARPFRRHRLGAVRGDGGRRDRAGARACGDAALSLHRRAVAARRRRLRQGAGNPLRRRADRRAGRGRRTRARADVRRPAARRRRGEHPEPRPRPDSDVDLQQVRRDGRHHRQQVGNVGRLRDALRRHERRLQSDQGRLQDRSLPPRRIAQPLEAGRRQGAGRNRHPARDHRPPADRRAAREPDRPGFAAALSDARRDPLSPGGKGDAALRHRRRRLRPRDGAQGRGAALSRRIQAPPVGAGRQGRLEELRPRPALSDRQPFPRFRSAGADARRVDRAARRARNERAVRRIAADCSWVDPHSAVMAGLDPAIQIVVDEGCDLGRRRREPFRGSRLLDGRVKPGHDAMSSNTHFRGSARA